MKIFTLIFTLFILSSSGLAKKKPSRFESLELFNKVIYLVENQYYRPVDMDKLVKGAIRGMMGALDPHSAFLDEKIFAKIHEETQGEFGGIGVEISMKEGVIVVITAIDDTPAFKAGLLPGDRIIEINHDNVVGLTLEEAVEKMRGKVGSSVTIGVQREGLEDTEYYTLKRKIIKINPVKSELAEGQFIYIRLAQFQKKAYRSIVKALKKHHAHAKKRGGAKGIVLDLRYNPGGLLEQAVDVASIFLRDGIVVQTEGRNPKDREIHYVKKTGYKDASTPMVVLINGSSASASEIVAGALQDLKRAVIMGSVSFGKGSVQSIAKIGEKMGVKLTIRQYMTPLRKKIQAIGIRPDVEIPEYTAKFIHENKPRDNFIRERDLRGHLVATIETPDEKKRRLAREREEKKKRAARIIRKKKEERNKPLRRYNPHEDYQVIQAMNYLKGYGVLQKK